MRQLKGLIVDDERLARLSLRTLLNSHQEINIIAEAASVSEALAAVQSHHPDLIFLDIQMPGGSGFDLLKQLDNPPAIIFVTAYDKYAIRAFEVNALDYLLKPVEPERLKSSLENIMKTSPLRCCHSADSHIPLSITDEVLLDSGTKCTLVPVEDILAIHAEGNYTRVTMNDEKEYLVRISLNLWEERLPVAEFKQLSRSILINIDRVCKWKFVGRGIILWFKDSSYILQLSRVATGRFKQNI